MHNLLQMMAAYNRWANARIYGEALALSDEAYRRDVGSFFKSLHGTLNHLLVGDRVWMRRFTGDGDHPDRLDAIIHDDLADLTRARIAEDARIIATIDALDDAALLAPIAYRNMAGKAHGQPLWEALLHFLNHQTHHRGQAHTILSIVKGGEPPSLDLLVMQRGGEAPDLEERLEGRI